MMNWSRSYFFGVLIISIAVITVIVWAVVDLQEENEKNNQSLRQALDSQARISRIINEMGFTGFIHDFKNYVLRGDKKYYLGAIEKIKNIDRFISVQKELNRQDDVSDLLNEVQSVLKKYEVKIEEVRRLHVLNVSVDEIDNQVMVDDSLAKVALQNLVKKLQISSNEIAIRIYNQKEKIILKIYFVVGVVALIMIFSVLAVLRFMMSERTEKAVINKILSKEKLFDSAPNPMLIVSESGEVVIANKGVADLFEMEKDKMLGLPLEALVPEALRSHHKSYRDAFFGSGGRKIMVNPVKIKTSNNVEKEIEVHIGLYELNKQQFAIANLVDVSEMGSMTRKVKDIEKTFQDTFENAPIGIAHLSVDGSFVKVNKKISEILGYSRYDLELMKIFDLKEKDVFSSDTELVRFLKNLDIDHYRTEKNYLRKDGTSVWVNLFTTIHRTQDGEPEYIISIMEDISKRKYFERNLLESERKFKTIVKYVNGVVWMASPGFQKMLYVSDDFEKVWKKSKEELYESTAFFVDSIHEEDKDRFVSTFENEFLEEWHLEYRINRKGDKVRYIQDEGTAIRNSQGEISHLVGLARDVTSEKLRKKKLEETNKQLEQLARFDPLTMSIRRQYALPDLEECIALFDRYGTDATLIFIDIDDFKQVNDLNGHDVGDQVLVNFSQLIRQNIRQTDDFYRYAGDEFLILLRETGLSDAVSFIRKLESQKLSFTNIKGAEVQVRFTCGASALAANSIVSANDWIKNADEQMYRYKGHRKTQFTGGAS